jgi:hypothetical protein
MSKATLQFYEAGGPHLNTTKEQAPAIMAKLVEFGVEFKTSHLDRMGYPDDKMQIILQGNSVEAEGCLTALCQEGLLETNSERRERQERLLQEIL